MPLRTRVRTQANEVRYALQAGQGLSRQWRETPRRLGWALALPLGAVLYARDRRAAGTGAAG